MNTKRILFHHPRKIGAESDSGSKVRPVKMLQAFKDLGYSVTLVDGTSNDRRHKMAAVRAEIESGTKFEFCYAENVPIPYAIADPDHIPRHPFIDRAFFRFLKAHNIPVGLFYRDIFWRFSAFKEWHNPLIRALCLPLFRFDLSYHTEAYIDRLFLPTEALAEHFPAYFSPPPIHALPPGSEIQTTARTNPEFEKKALYVGGILPPVYNLKPLFEVFARLPDWEFTIVCRKSEYDSAATLYPWEKLPNLYIKHESAEELVSTYQENSVFLWIREPHPYLDIAIPVKLLEAWGHGLPIMTNSQACDAALIKEEGGGWVEPDTSAMVERLRGFESSPEEWAQRQHATLEIRTRHTWRQRAETVGQLLKPDSRMVSS